MKRPIRFNRFLISFGAVIIIGLVPIALMGFIATPNQKHTGKITLDIDALMKRVLDLNHKKQHQKAIDLLLSALEQHSEDSALRALLIQSFDLFLEEEIRRGQKDIEKDPKNKDAYYSVASALELLGDNFRASEVIIKGISYNPKSSQLWMKVAKLELKASRKQEALDVFKEIIRIDSKNADAYNNAAHLLVELYNNKKDLDEAELFAKKAHKLDPKNVQYMDTLAEVYFRRGDTKLAKTYIKEAIRLEPKNQALRSQLQKILGDQTNDKR